MQVQGVQRRERGWWHMTCWRGILTTVSTAPMCAAVAVVVVVKFSKNELINQNSKINPK